MLLGEGFELGRARRVATDTETLDTADQRLGRAGVVVTVEGDRWVMTCANYGSVGFDGGGDRQPPAALRQALIGLSRGAPLELASRLRRRGRLLPVLSRPRVDDADPVGELVDEDLSVLDARRIVSRQRYLSVTGTAPVLAEVRRRLDTQAMGSRVVTDIGVLAPLGPPDPAPWPLESRPTAGVVIQRALARSVARLLAHDPVVRTDLHPEGVHQMRVAVRRLRSDLRSFADLLAPPSEHLLADLRWLGALLGAVRDLDVLRGGLERDLAALDQRDRRSAKPLLVTLSTERREAHDRLLAALATERYLTMLEALVELAANPPLTEAAAGPAASVLAVPARVTWRRLRQAARQAGAADADIDTVHALRLRAKRFRYAVDALIDVQPAAGPHAEALSQLQDVLGEFNDACVAEDWLRQRAAEAEPAVAFVLGQLVMVQHRSAARCQAAWPKAWERVRRHRRSAWLDPHG